MASLLSPIALPSVVAPSADEELLLRREESRLLNRRLTLGAGLRIWNRQTRLWEDYRPTTARLTVLNLWSVDCPPCIAEMPTIDAMAKQLKREFGGFSLLLISETTDERELFLAIDKHKLFINQENIVVYSGKALRATLGTKKKPITLLLDRNSVIRQAFVGSIMNRRGELANSVVKLAEVEQ